MAAGVSDPVAGAFEVDRADPAAAAPTDENPAELRDLVSALAAHRWWLLLGPPVVGAIALGITYLIPPTYTASTTFLPPQQQQSAAASAIASLGPLANLAGGAGGLRTPADQYVSLMQSNLVSDRIIERFGLMKAYEKDLRVDTREKLLRNVRINVGKKDGLVTVEVDDESPQRAADMANRYVDELRDTTSKLALTEAQQRRQFFERLLQQTRDQLDKAQQALQASGFNPGALRAEPKAAAEGYARLKAEVTSAEVRLQTLRGSLADDTPEVRQQQAALSALRAQVGRLEQSASSVGGSSEGPGYVGKYRDFKYQEALFELYARQFELARVDESREGALIQVIDVATPPERKSKPKRATTAIGSALAAAVLLTVVALLRQSGRRRT